jgi:hypothetical protein
MALRPPSAAALRPHHRISIRMPTSAAAAEVKERAGGLLRLGSGDRDDVALVIGEVTGDAVLSGGHLRDPEWFSEGRPVVVSWTELNDWATLQGHIEYHRPQQLAVECEWPPVREQRREFRRHALDLPIWVSRGVHQPELHGGRTRDVSGGGVAAEVADHGCSEGERVLTVVRGGGRDVLAAATVQWARPSTGLVGLKFDLISPADQDHLVGLVAKEEARWGR